MFCSIGIAISFEHIEAMRRLAISPCWCLLGWDSQKVRRHVIYLFACIFPIARELAAANFSWQSTNICSPLIIWPTSALSSWRRLHCAIVQRTLSFPFSAFECPDAGGVGLILLRNEYHPSLFCTWIVGDEWWFARSAAAYLHCRNGRTEIPWNADSIW